MPYLAPYDLDSMPCSVSCSELMRILQRSSLAILLCLMSEMAVTSVSMALAYSPEAAKARMLQCVKTHIYTVITVVRAKVSHRNENISHNDGWTSQTQPPTCSRVLHGARDGAAHDSLVTLENLLEFLFADLRRRRLGVSAATSYKSYVIPRRMSKPHTD